MTIDETPRGSGGGGERPGMRTSAHEIERYGGLFAQRTRGMTSSAMRDMMAVTARPEVPWWDPGADASVNPETDSVMVGGHVVSRGTRVLLRPRGRADAR